MARGERESHTEPRQFTATPSGQEPRWRERFSKASLTGAGSARYICLMPQKWGGLFLNVLLMTLSTKRSREIAALNDLARKTFQGCRVVLTEGILNLPDSLQFEVLQSVRNFGQFTPDNDPYEEHDFGAFDLDGHRVFWKFDYFDVRSQYLSADPTSTELTNRVLTIMLADEY